MRDAHPSRHMARGYVVFGLHLREPLVGERAILEAVSVGPAFALAAKDDGAGE